MALRSPTTRRRHSTWTRTACAAIAVAGVTAFGVAAALSRTTHPSHVKHRPAALAAPPAFLKAVRDSQLDTQPVAVAQAPSQPTSATS
jgi:hypothetical protein